MIKRWLARRIVAYIEKNLKRECDFAVTRDGGERIYMRRWWLIPRNNRCNVYLHQMLMDDDAVLHDHMYWSLSFVLTDGLEEVYCLDPRRDFLFVYDEATGNYDRAEYVTKRRVFRQGQLVWRSSRMAHQIIVKKPGWTIFVTGPRIKDWGFWCPKGFRHWSRYVALDQNPDGSGRGLSGVGFGCGEQS